MDLDRIIYTFIFYKPNRRRNIEIPKSIAEEFPGVRIGHLAESMKYVL
jgi:hypothetical protein